MDSGFCEIYTTFWPSRQTPSQSCGVSVAASGAVIRASLVAAGRVRTRIAASPIARNITCSLPPDSLSNAPKHRAASRFVTGGAGMLLKLEVLEASRDGRITLQFRRWTRPSVKPGGTLKTKVGLLQIGRIDGMHPADVPAADARKAGFR